jgi:hypothetical protein
VDWSYDHITHDVKVPRKTAVTFSPFHLFTLLRYHVFTFSRFRVFTFSRFHVFTFSRFHVFTFSQDDIDGSTEQSYHGPGIVDTLHQLDVWINTDASANTGSDVQSDSSDAGADVGGDHLGDG